MTVNSSRAAFQNNTKWSWNSAASKIIKTSIGSVSALALMNYSESIVHAIGPVMTKSIIYSRLYPWQISAAVAGVALITYGISKARNSRKSGGIKKKFSKNGIFKKRDSSKLFSKAVFTHEPKEKTEKPFDEDVSTDSEKIEKPLTRFFTPESKGIEDHERPLLIKIHSNDDKEEVQDKLGEGASGLVKAYTSVHDGVDKIVFSKVAVKGFEAPSDKGINDYDNFKEFLTYLNEDEKEQFLKIYTNIGPLDSNYPYHLVMEKFDGCLESYYFNLNCKEKIEVSESLVSQLTILLQKGFILTDLKFQNVLVKELKDGKRVALSDFSGLTNFSKINSELKISQFHYKLKCSTPEFFLYSEFQDLKSELMNPNSIKSNLEAHVIKMKSLLNAFSVFTLAAMLYVLWTGKMSYFPLNCSEAKDCPEELHGFTSLIPNPNVNHTKVQSEELKKNGCPDTLQAFILKALDVKPAKRPQFINKSFLSSWF